MILFYLLITALICICYLLLWILWERIPINAVKNNTEGVSVIIPVRNESETIGKLLNSLNDQSFSKHKMEVLVVDDHSEDDTVKVVRQVAMHCQFPVKCIQLSEDQFGKKIASTVGNDHAKYDIILCTDGDTEVQSDWIASMTGPLAKENMQMVSGPVRMVGRSFIEQLQIIEFSGLIAVGAVTLYKGKPTMCNGANMAYRKSAFLEVNGYMDNLHIPSGDDEFLLRKINHRYPQSTRFIKSQDALVTTSAKQSLEALWQQRVRWISKWRFHKSTFINLLSTLSFLIFLGFGVSLLVLLFTKPEVILAGYLILLLSVGAFLNRTSRFVRHNLKYPSLLCLVFIYPYYAVVLGIASIFGAYSWKGRRYR